MRHTRLAHKFVQNIPDRLEPGVLYISIEYATAAHSCCCGCGEEVVTPFTPVDWKMTFDGDTISLNPSIGNWNFACRSHYWIEHSQVFQALPWTEKKIATNRQRDAAMREDFYSKDESINADLNIPSHPVISHSSSLWLKVRVWLEKLKP